MRSLFVSYVYTALGRDWQPGDVCLEVLHTPWDADEVEALRDMIVATYREPQNVSVSIVWWKDMGPLGSVPGRTEG